MDFIGKQSVNTDKTVYVTTSWDDGTVEDVKLAKLLDRYGLKGTFYCLLHSNEFNLMSVKDLLDIARNHEVGAHTIGHCDLRRLPGIKLKEDILSSKEELSKIIGKDVTMFCYPYGKYNKRVVDAVKISGFKGARIVRWLCSNKPTDPYRIAPTAHAYPHSRFINIGHLIKNLDFKGFAGYIGKANMTDKWVDIAINMFDCINKEGGTWHLWGHSREIENLNLWDSLESVFKYVSNRQNVVYCTNGELIDKIFKN